jgi:multiple sugar transport system permease protein
MMCPRVYMRILMEWRIFSFLISWNEFVYAALLTTSPNAQTIPVTIGILVGVVKYEVWHYGALFAVGVVAIIPPVLIAFGLQRYLVQGMLSGSTKG